MASRGKKPASDRDRRAAANPLPPLAGSLAGTADLHRFQELTHGQGGSQCAHCFGWRDDTRHDYPKAVLRG